MPQSIRLVLYFRGPAMAQTALTRTRPAKMVMAGLPGVLKVSQNAGHFANFLATPGSSAID
jgi:hypothetical protein